MAFNTLELKNMKLDSDDNFDGDDPETYVTLMTSCDRFKQCKACKKKNKPRINICSMTFNNMVGLLRFRRWEKRNRNIFGWWKLPSGHL